MDTLLMKTIVSSMQFDRWIKKLRDKRAMAKILFRIVQLKTKGHYGDVKSVGAGVKELRIPEGRGYRVYFVEIDDLVILLLLGGSKARQSSDRKKAKNIWNELKKEDYL